MTKFEDLGVQDKNTGLTLRCVPRKWELQGKYQYHFDKKTGHYRFHPYHENSNRAFLMPCRRYVNDEGLVTLDSRQYLPTEMN